LSGARARPDDDELTQRAALKKACARHLRDLRAAYATPPASRVPAASDGRGIVRRAEATSGCSSPFAWL
jgi:hypothetical protein